MTAYIDASVLLRVLLNESEKLKSVVEYQDLISSELLRLECMRVLYRYRMTGHFSDQSLGKKITEANELFDEISLIPVTRLILQRATMPTPTILGTLDSLHFASAQVWMERKNATLTMLTHDEQLKSACLAVGIAVEG